MTSKRGSRLGSMEDEEASQKAMSEQTIRTKGGKIINRLETNEQRDNNQMELIPDPFAAEQTYLSEEDIKAA